MKKLFLAAAMILMTTGFASAQCCRTANGEKPKCECKDGKTCPCKKDGKACPCNKKKCNKKGTCKNSKNCKNTKCCTKVAK